MASQEWNNIDNTKIYADEYYCAFLDILGYKDKAERFFDNKFNLEGRFNRALNNAIVAMKITSTLVKSDDIKVMFFSDSIILLLPKNQETQDQLFSLLSFCANLSAHLSYEDLFVRGGISFGPHKESQNNNGSSFLASIALQKAYLLESKKACNPRIILDNDLVPMLGINEKILIAKEGADYFVHFAPLIVNRNGDNTNEVLKEMKDIEQAKAFAPEDRAAEKYVWVLDYYYWMLSTISNVDLSPFQKFKSNENRNFSLV